MKVYIVTKGSYSDYHIERVFLQKEKAEIYNKIIDSEAKDAKEWLYSQSDEKIIKIIY